jgi:uncharacterized protein (UPF0335 family)
MTKQPTVSTDSGAQDQIRAFVDRIIRMREEKRAIQSDINEIYAEAKGNGLDKTILGKAVLRVEKQATNASEQLEQDALLDMYLEAYFGTPSRTHAHAREDDEQENQRYAGRAREAQSRLSSSGNEPAESGPPDVAAVTEPQPLSEAEEERPDSSAPIQPETANSTQPQGQSGKSDNAGGENEAVARSPIDTGTAREEAVAAVTNDDSVRRADASTVALGSDVETVASIPEPDGGAGGIPVTASEPAAEEGGRVSSAATNVVPIKKQWKQSDPAHKDCLNPMGCGGFSNLGLCPGCKAAAGMSQIEHRGQVS